MNQVHALLNRERGLPYDQSYDFALQRLSVAREDSWRGIQPSHYSSDYNPEPPIFAAKFANCNGYRHILAIANEDGKIALQDTTKRNYKLEEQALAAPQCHYNAVFDLEWAPKQMRFVSASGDHTAQLWEVTDSELVQVNHYFGHSRSVKTAAFRKNDNFVFATGGRDGTIIIWDTRARLNVDRTPRADNYIWSGHMGGPGTPISQKKRARTPKLNTGTTSSSITGLAFQDGNTLISCGAGDGVIKVWDLRRNYSSYKKEPLPKHSLPYAGSSTYKGFTNLIVNEMGTHLYANCMDNTIYCYNIHSYESKPLARYKGFLNSTFYIKSCLSPDGKYLLSGSSDEKAYIWNLNYPDEPIVALCGHTVEVTCVAWGTTHDRPIVTCSDDARHKIWRIGPEQITDSDRIELYRGHAEYVRKFTSRTTTNNKHKYNLRDLESTPRSLKRFVEQNERTPNSTDKVSNKRSFLDMLGATSMGNTGEDQQELKRPKTLESRGRRLFSPSTTNATLASCSSSISPTVRCLNVQLQTIPEESSSALHYEKNSINGHDSCDSNQENTPANLLQNNDHHNTITTPSPLGKRSDTLPLNYTSPLGSSIASNLAQSTTNASNVFSPTSNLPNYVIDGDAPHLGIMSPKRKHKDKVDWLTNLRKQKLMSVHRNTEISTTLSQKLQESTTLANNLTSSPRLQHLRESSPRLITTPRRRVSHAERHHEQILSPSSSSSANHYHPKTPTSSRRNSETSILRFFSIQSQSRNITSTNSISINNTESVGSNIHHSPSPMSSLENSNTSNTISTVARVTQPTAVID